MARQLINLTTDWQEIAQSEATIVVAKVNIEAPNSKALFNDAESDTAAEIVIPVEKGTQIHQTLNRATYARATTEGWSVTVDAL